MNFMSARPEWMISRAIALASAMSLPTSIPNHRSAHSAELVRRGSTATSRPPLRTPRKRWWKKIGWVSRALEPQSKTRSVSSASRYEEVPPPAPNAVARPTTLGACQVRLQLSMLLLPMTTRANFWAMKFISFVVLEQLNMPKAFGPIALAFANPSAARASASSHDAGRRRPPSLTRGSVKRTLPSSIVLLNIAPHVDATGRCNLARYACRGSTGRTGVSGLRARFSRRLRSPLSRQLPADLPDHACGPGRSRRGRGLHTGCIRARLPSLGAMAPGCSRGGLAAQDRDQRGRVAPAQREAAIHRRDPTAAGQTPIGS